MREASQGKQSRLSALISDLEADNRFLVFTVGGEGFCAPLMDVREIIEPVPVKPVPNTKSYFLGVINLRGEIVGVLDMRLRMGVEAKPHMHNVLIVYDSPAGPIAALVDRVDQVVNIDTEKLDKSPSVVTKLPLEYLIGVAQHGDRLLTTVNLKKMLAEEELVALRHAS